jgi:signal peptidase I
MAPEQRQTPTDVDHRADIYSLGVVFYELLTGELPTGALPVPSALSAADPRVDAIVQQALEHERARRQHSAGEMKTQVSLLSADYSPAEITVVMEQVRRNRGFEYKSPRTLCGLPLLHVVAGMDPATGKQRVARGILAIGGRAHGWIAFGGVATGGVAFGGCAIGVVAIGGCAMGMVALGGCAIALLLALGGFSIGYMALGGNGIGAFVVDSMNHPSWFDERLQNTFQTTVRNHAGLAISGFILVLSFLIGFPMVMSAWARRRALQQGIDGRPSALKASPVAPPNWKYRIWKIARTVLIALGIALFLRAFVLQPFRIPVNAYAPEIPQGSWVLAWKLTRNYAPGDFIVYVEAQQHYLGKVIAVRETEIQVRRHGKDDHVVPQAQVIGRVIVNSRTNQSQPRAVKGTIYDKNGRLLQQDERPPLSELLRPSPFPMPYSPGTGTPPSP